MEDLIGPLVAIFLVVAAVGAFIAAVLFIGIPILFGVAGAGFFHGMWLAVRNFFDVFKEAQSKVGP